MEILRRFDHKEGEASGSFEVLLPTLCRAFKVDETVELGVEIAAAQTKNLNSGRVGPWMKQGWEPSMRKPEDHGIDIDKQHVLEMCARLSRDRSEPSS